jgi:hypothetical protein
MPLPTDYTNDTVSQNLHPDAHNDVNAAVNALTARFDAVTDPEGGGISTLNRRQLVSTTALLSQRLALGFVTAPTAMTVTKVRTYTGNAAAAATPTLAQFALYNVDGTGAMTLVASTANDTTLFAAPSTMYERPFTASVDLIAGQRYAAGVQVNSGVAMPQLVTSLGNVVGAQVTLAYPPRLVYLNPVAAALPPTIAAPTAGQNSFAIPYIVLLP